MGDVMAPQALRAQGAKGQSFLRDLLRRLIRERLVSAVSGVIVLLLSLVATFADLRAPFHYMNMEMTMVDRLKGPSSTYPLGTDHIGRDVLSRLLYGARVSLGVGFVATTLSVVVSLLIGWVAGFVGGMLALASGVANSRAVRGAVIGIKGNAYYEAAHGRMPSAARRGGRCCAMCGPTSRSAGRSSRRPA